MINNNYQIGVGGHINKGDLENQEDILEAGKMREWEEEVDYRGGFISKKLVGILNDDTNPVEEVHLGLVYNFVGDSPEISIKETDKMEGKLFDLKEIVGDINHSPWMKIVYEEYLLKMKND